jgi:hypothetical protein
MSSFRRSHGEPRHPAAALSVVLRGVSRPRLIATLVAALLGAVIVWGLAGALATSSTPPPASVLRLGITGHAPNNLNPFMLYGSSCAD